MGLIFFLFQCHESIYQQLEALPGIEVEQVKSSPGFAHIYALTVQQPLDHDQQEKGYFKQRVYVCLRDVSRPVIFETEGYGLSEFIWQPPNREELEALPPANRQRRTSKDDGFPNQWSYRWELSQLLKANLVSVEYRFFGQSKPKGEVPWAYLTLEQAAKDHHAIVQSLKKVFPAKWLNTGFSKGGESALIHRAMFPDDVIATIAYDAPLILDTEDRRTDDFIRQNLEDSSEGAELIRFQRACLIRREELIKELALLGASRGWDFPLGLDATIEYAVLEVPFSFWQRGQSFDDIPPEGAPARQLLDFMQAGGGFWVYSQQGITALEPSFYQHFKQLGYYGFSTEGVADLLFAVPDPSNRAFLPKNTAVVYDPDRIQKTVAWLKHHGTRIIYLYGACDTWYGCAPEINAENQQYQFVDALGYHGSTIRNLAPHQQETFRNIVMAWLEE